MNPKYVPEFEAAGLKFVGRDVDNERMEVNPLLFYSIICLRCDLLEGGFMNHKKADHFAVCKPILIFFSFAVRPGRTFFLYPLNIFLLFTNISLVTDNDFKVDIIYWYVYTYSA